MEKKKKFIVNITFYFIIALIVWAFCKYFLPVLVPFICAFLIASLLHVPIRKICKNEGKIKRLISIILCIVFFVLVSLGITAIGIKIVTSAAGFIKAAPTLYREVIVPVISMLADDLQTAIASWDPGVAASIEDWLLDFVNNIGNYITNLSVNAVKLISGGIVSIPGVLIKIIIMVISTFFCMVDYDKIIAFFNKCIPKGKENSVKQFGNYAKNTIMIYVKSYSLLFLLTYVELCIGFKLLGIPYPVTIALLIAIFDILPVLGVGGILLPWFVILLAMQEFPMAIGMITLYLVITIIRNTLEPKIVGQQIGLHPLATLIFMYLGLKVLGFVGMFLFPVTLALVVNMKDNVSFDFSSKKDAVTKDDTI